MKGAIALFIAGVSVAGMPRWFQVVGISLILIASLAYYGAFSWFFEELKRSAGTRLNARSYVFGMVWALAVMAVSRVGWFGSEFDTGTTLFLMCIGFLVYVYSSRQVYGSIALLCLLHVPLLLFGNYEKQAEVVAITAYWFLAAAVIAGIKEVYTENSNEKKVAQSTK